MFTPEQQEDYKNHLGLKCPFCGDDDVSSEMQEMDMDPLNIRIPVVCKTCGKKWDEEWTLNQIVPAKNP